MTFPKNDIRAFLLSLYRKISRTPVEILKKLFTNESLTVENSSQMNKWERSRMNNLQWRILKSQLAIHMTMQNHYRADFCEFLCTREKVVERQWILSKVN